MHKDLVTKLKERGKHFFQVAIFDAEKGRYDLALFHLEQSLQLLLKSKLLEIAGDFPKIHSLKDLFALLEEFFPNLDKIVDENILIIDVLEDAYIASRYLGAEYGKKEFDICRNFVKKLWSEIWDESV
ncbi:MAG TPA: HEPN domain-containing protein [Candidatus Altiarchaeales archaeon]|nr:MAG: DNA-binding protein [Candidatus Altiarchaeales archaeon]HDN83628.1 HEPN domain-containing protein [Candidatus Altiarchaeales archaeon]